MQNKSKKLILDACCGSRMFWFNKANPDLVADFTDMPFEDESFYLVVFDPPHLKSLGENSWMAKKYGRLPYDWQFMIQKGFNECMRVLKPKALYSYPQKVASILIRGLDANAINTTKAKIFNR